MKNLAIIPARGGSKRIPRKNIRDFLEKPIIVYSIETALQSCLFDEIMVSTDDEEIASLSLQYGAKVPFIRNEQTSTDNATLCDVIEEVKGMYKEQGVFFDNICCILPTAPLLTIDMLKNGLHLLIEKDVDSVRPVVKFGYPIQRSLRMYEDGLVNFFYPQYARTPSQDLESVYYWMKSSVGLVGEKRYAFEIQEIYCQDIDNEVDWKLAELKYKALHKD